MPAPRRAHLPIGSNTTSYQTGRHGTPPSDTGKPSRSFAMTTTQTAGHAKAPDPAFTVLNALADRVERSDVVQIDGNNLTMQEEVLIELALRAYAERFR